jgi:hypothetical protein
MFGPRFDVASPLDVAQAGGEIATMSRGNLDGSLEVATSVGPFPPLAPSKTFVGRPSGTVAAYNIAHATVGKQLFLPGDTEFWLVEATVVLQLVQSQGRQPVRWENFMALLPGSENLPLGGLAVGWCDIIVSLHTPNGSATEVSKLVAGDVATGRNEHIEGGFYAITPITAVFAPGTSGYWLMVDSRAFSWAEGTAGGGQAFTEIAIHEPFPGDSLLSFGFATALGVLRVVEIIVKTCPVPVLSSTAASKQKAAS